MGVDELRITGEVGRWPDRHPTEQASQFVYPVIPRGVLIAGLQLSAQSYLHIQGHPGRKIIPLKTRDLSACLWIGCVCLCLCPTGYGREKESSNGSEEAKRFACGWLHPG